MNAATSVQEVTLSHPIFIDIAVHYLRPKQVVFIKETVQYVMREVIHQDDLDLETDPCVVRRLVSDFGAHRLTKQLTGRSTDRMSMLKK